MTAPEHVCGSTENNEQEKEAGCHDDIPANQTNQFYLNETTQRRAFVLPGLCRATLVFLLSSFFTIAVAEESIFSIQDWNRA